MSDMSLDLELLPGYISPLTDKDHARIGRVVILWGQVEYFIDELLPLVSGLSLEDLQTLGVVDKNVQAKSQFLKSTRRLLSNEGTSERVGEFCEQIDRTKVARNHLTHGIWGWRANSRSKTVDPCVRHRKHPNKPLKVAELIRLEKDLCKCSRLGVNLTLEFEGRSETGAARYFHGNENDFPQWLLQWIKRNPPNDEALDQRGKAGQLPRLAKPYPRK